MKTLLVLIFATLPFLGFSQTQPPGLFGKKPQPIDLKLDKVEQVKQRERQIAEKHIIIGGVLSVLGLGVGIVGPMLVSEPVDPTPTYLNEVRGAGNNTSAATIITNKYKSDYAAYTEKIDDNKHLVNGLRLGGAGMFAVGIGFGFGGMIKMAKNSN